MEIWGTFFSWTCPWGDCRCLHVLGGFVSVSAVIFLCMHFHFYMASPGCGGGRGGWAVRVAQVDLPSSELTAHTAASLRSQDRIIFRSWRCIWLVHLDFISWLPFPALRFLPLGLYLRYREPHQPVQHQRNTSATCCTHLHPPEGTPVCGGWDQHQWSKCHCCHCCHHHTLGHAEQQPQHEPLPSFSWFNFIPRTLPHPSREAEGSEVETCFWFSAVAGMISVLLTWCFVLFLLPQPTNPGFMGSCSKQEKVPVLTALHFQGHSRIWQEKPAA